MSPKHPDEFYLIFMLYKQSPVGDLYSYVLTCLTQNFVEDRGEAFEALTELVEWPQAIWAGYGIYKDLGDRPDERMCNALVLADAGLLAEFARLHYNDRAKGYL